jgi:glucose-6-phosphate 1-dehydrogenase
MSYPLEEPGYIPRFIDPCVLIIFGATGDLTARKLLPAIYNLAREGALPSQFACIGFARREKSHEQFRQEMKQAISEHSRTGPVDESVWQSFKEQLFYHRAEFHEKKGYETLHAFLQQLENRLGTKGNRVFYLSTQPSFFPVICEQLHESGLLYDQSKVKDRFSRVIIEKPFGYDLASARALQEHLLKFLSEEQIFRIDHYLGKESVQNLLVFRFANAIFESLWNNRYIDHIQITVAEDIGIEGRGTFFEEAGLLRDIVQNHMMQLLSLVAMEPPVSLTADAIRDEKVKALQAVRPLDLQDAVRGQYGAGYIGGEATLPYRQEKNVSPDSHVETYVALRLFVDNWRWHGVPFYLRAGKRLAKRATEIAIFFKHPPAVLFQQQHLRAANLLVIRIQPNEGCALKINCKVPGSSSIQPVKMDFRYGSYFGGSPPEAYERLILDCMVGDSTLFARDDEVFQSWQLLTPLIEVWKETAAVHFPNYSAGTWGPAEANALIEKEGRKWRRI